jgi:hypothetical protein
LTKVARQQQWIFLIVAKLISELSSSQIVPSSQAHINYLLKQVAASDPRSAKMLAQTLEKPWSTTKGNVKPLDSRGQPHRMSVDDKGNVIPGGGPADAPPDGGEAMQMVTRAARSGVKYSDLPKRAPTKEAERKKEERDTVKNDKVVARASRPPGTATAARQQGKVGRRRFVPAGTHIPGVTSGTTSGTGWKALDPEQAKAARAWSKQAQRRARPTGTKRSGVASKPQAPSKGKFRGFPPQRKVDNASKERYLSNTISEDFGHSLDSVLGL